MDGWTDRQSGFCQLCVDSSSLQNTAEDPFDRHMCLKYIADAIMYAYSYMFDYVWFYNTQWEPSYFMPCDEKPRVFESTCSMLYCSIIGTTCLWPDFTVSRDTQLLQK